MTEHISFELAKLLKEKGFDVIKDYFYDIDGKLYKPMFISNDIPAPTIVEVVMWLYEKHDIWISPIPDSSSGYQLLMRKMSVHLFRYRNGLNVQTETLRDSNRNIIYFLSPNQAYESAIEYCLTELI